MMVLRKEIYKKKADLRITKFPFAMPRSNDKSHYYYNHYYYYHHHYSYIHTYIINNYNIFFETILFRTY